MEQTKNITKAIEELIASDVSTNQIARETILNIATVSRLRNGKIEVDNMTWQNIRALYKYAHQQLQLQHKTTNLKIFNKNN